MNKIIKTFLLAIIMLASYGTMTAQNSNKQRLTREQLAVVQAKHIAKEMEMDDTNCDKFIETYCQCQKEIWALGPRTRRQDRTASTTDADAEKDIEQRFEHSQKILSIRKKYYAEYSKFLTPIQIQRIYKLEKQMMNRLAGRNGNPN